VTGCIGSRRAGPGRESSASAGRADPGAPGIRGAARAQASRFARARGSIFSRVSSGWIALIQLDRAVGLEWRRDGAQWCGRAPLEESGAELESFSLICLARSRQPEQRKREAVVSRVGGFAGRHCQRATEADRAGEVPGVVPGERMLEIRETVSDSRVSSGIARKETRQPIAKLSPGQLAGAALESLRINSRPIGLTGQKRSTAKRQPALGIIGDARTRRVRLNRSDHK